MWGWLSAAIARASLSKRSTWGAVSRLMATMRPSRVSRAFHTSPYPARTDGREDFVWAEASAGLQCHGSACRDYTCHAEPLAGTSREVLSPSMCCIGQRCPWHLPNTSHTIAFRRFAHMQLEVAARVGPYDVVAPLGAGGMGEVYRARDTKLNRDIAIKVLPE